jgi:ankyrin repeat protein
MPVSTPVCRPPRRSDVAIVSTVACLLVVALVSGLRGATGALPLVDAVRRGDPSAVRTLLRGRPDVNAAEADGTTALHVAVQADNLEMTRMLLRAGANANAANRYGVKPILLAATNGSAPVLELLLASGADPRATSGGGEPVVMTAARTGSVGTVKALVAKGADVNVREPWFGETALMWAAAENHGDMVRVLAELGADVNARSRILEAPVLEFPRSGGPNSPLPRGGWTPLMYAARDGALQAARALAEGGADLDATALPQTDVALTPEEIQSGDHGRGTTALVFAIINAHYDLAGVLLDNGADPNVADRSGMAALYAAVDMNSLQWVQGRPAPVLTDRLDAVDLVARLLDKRADPNARLTRAPLKRHHDAGTTLGLGEGTTPLIRAAKTNDVAVMRLLLSRGADPALTLKDGTTALMVAAGLGYGGLRGEGIRIVVPTPQGAAEAVRLLLAGGLNVNASNEAGNTALHGAVTRGDSVVELLAAHGATLDVKNKAGFTPLDLANGLGGRGGRPGVVRESTVTLLKRLMSARP